MFKRKKMYGRKDKRKFSRTASKVHKRNKRAMPMRGGTRI